AVIVRVRQHNFGRPYGLLVRLRRKPYVKLRARFGMDMPSASPWPWPHQGKFTGGKAGDLLLEGADGAFLPPRRDQPELLDHGRLGALAELLETQMVNRAKVDDDVRRVGVAHLFPSQT